VVSACWPFSLVFPPALIRDINPLALHSNLISKLILRCKHFWPLIILSIHFWCIMLIFVLKVYYIICLGQFTLVQAVKCQMFVMSSFFLRNGFRETVCASTWSHRYNCALPHGVHQQETIDSTQAVLALLHLSAAYDSVHDETLLIVWRNRMVLEAACTTGSSLNLVVDFSPFSFWTDYISSVHRTSALTGSCTQLGPHTDAHRYMAFVDLVKFPSS